MTLLTQVNFDCDPGQDDAIALLYALGSKNIDIGSITVVGGNVDLDQCARNALQILEITDRTDVLVYKGCATPLERSLITLPDVFGPTGMAGAEDLLQPTCRASNINAVDFLCNDFQSKTIIATAPLTNISSALIKKPSLEDQIDNLILMGGCVRPDPVFNRMGNLTVQGLSKGRAEYNFAIDPEAAKIVFKSNIKNISLIGLDVTRTILFNGEVQKRLNDVGTKSAILASKILSTVGVEDVGAYKNLWSYPNDPVRAMHDIVAMAYADKPEIFETEILPIRIDVENIPGQSLIDDQNPDYKNVTVITNLDRGAFIDALCKNLGKLK